ncbi:manganese/iron transport system ATP-binding protein [Desulfotomaculum arcticum]|uniref:Manganese/iron transport system ATP-binding protein n=1 Tax=Desulfotruncus arcticus DSM 17038 TaxID=1121424 RepID=A0A1I2T4L1_9FIRM|nr:metal ABC transporter ATP-binding protein [Desulfotruncus arcticus]SFG57386.1 manganese/iron transport system ATP-binding protein [Desulfotomaculum arcticum] [Desulfotruncus arcticus DSM 17038]
MAETIISLQNAVVSYREDVALQGVTLEIQRGELVGILGPNGSGKTTILTLVNGLGKLLQGNVRVLNHAAGSSFPATLRKKIGYVPQVHNIDPRMPVSVKEVVMMGRYGQLGMLRRPGAPDRQMVESMLRLVGMTHLAERPIGHLSGGEQQRVAIARALAQEPDILLLDEPTTGLDRRARTEIMHMVHEIHRDRGLTTLMVTHEHKTAAALCNRVILMKEGRVWAHGQPRELLRETVLNRLYDL